MKRYAAYTQTDWNSEKFYIENEEQETLIIEAENEEEAAEMFTAYIYETSLYNDDVTVNWLKENPITVYEV